MTFWPAGDRTYRMDQVDKEQPALIGSLVSVGHAAILAEIRQHACSSSMVLLEVA
jgi:hypothetical protein